MSVKLKNLLFNMRTGWSVSRLPSEPENLPERVRYGCWILDTTGYSTAGWSGQMVWKPLLLLEVQLEQFHNSLTIINASPTFYRPTPGLFIFLLFFFSS